MALEYPYVLLNFKTAAETAGEDGLAFARAIERVGAATGTRFGDVGPIVDRCAALGLESIVAVRSREQARAALAFDPDCLLFERPADIDSEDATVRTEPERIEAVVDAVAAEGPQTRVFVGGGIRTADDVERGFARDGDATGAASAALEAKDRVAWLRSIADAVPDALE